MLTNYVLEVLKHQNNILKFQKKRKTYLMILILQYELLCELMLLINRLLDLHHILLLFLKMLKLRKTTTRMVHSIHFILKGEECEIFIYSVTIIIIHFVTYKYSYIYAYKCAYFLNNNQLVC